MKSHLCSDIMSGEYFLLNDFIERANKNLP